MRGNARTRSADLADRREDRIFQSAILSGIAAAWHRFQIAREAQARFLDVAVLAGHGDHLRAQAGVGLDKGLFDERRRQGDGLFGVESYLKTSEGGILPDNVDIPQEEKVRIHPYLVLGLFKELYQVSKKLGITHWYMITEKKLWYALKRFDLIFRQIGEPVEYHGLRIPYLGVIEEIEQNLMKKHMDFYKGFLTGLDKQYWPSELR